MLKCSDRNRPSPLLFRKPPDTESDKLRETEVQPKGGRVRISSGAQEGLGQRPEGRWKPHTA